MPIPNDCFSVPYLLYEQFIYKLSVKIEKKDELIRIYKYNGFELFRAFILISVQHYVRSHNFRSNKVR